MLGKLGRSAIGVLVERRSRYVLLLHLPEGRTAPHVRRALVEQMITLPDQLKRSLTWDQGKEMAKHVPLQHRERRIGLLLRSAQPLATRDQREHQRPAPPILPQGNRSLRPPTGRPRQTLGWLKPCEAFARTVALTT